MNNNKSLANTLQPFVIGLALGTTAGILLAPRKGIRTRNKLRKKGEDIKDIFKIKLMNTMEGVKTKLDSSAEKINSYLAIEKSLNDRITKLTTKILNNCPELFNYIGEMNEDQYFSTNPEVTIKNLKSYLETLETMYTKYMKQQVSVAS